MLMPPRKKAFSGVQHLYYYYAALLSVQFGACYSGARTPVGVVGTDQQQQQQQSGVVARTNEEKNVEKCNFIMSCVDAFPRATKREARARCLQFIRNADVRTLLLSGLC